MTQENKKCCPKCNFKGVAHESDKMVAFGEEYCGRPDCLCHQQNQDKVRCAKCNGPFLTHHHQHITREGIFHTNCYKTRLENQEKVGYETATPEQKREMVSEIVKEANAEQRKMTENQEKCEKCNRLECHTFKEVWGDGCHCPCHQQNQEKRTWREIEILAQEATKPGNQESEWGIDQFIERWLGGFKCGCEYHSGNCTVAFRMKEDLVYLLSNQKSSLVELAKVKINEARKQEDGSLTDEMGVNRDYLTHGWNLGLGKALEILDLLKRD